MGPNTVVVLVIGVGMGVLALGSWVFAMKRRLNQQSQRLLHQRRRVELLQARYHKLLDNANDVFFSLDRSGRFTEVNQRTEHLTGYTRAEMLKMTYPEVVAPPHVERSRDLFRRLMAGEKIQPFELEIKAKDSRIIMLEMHAMVQQQDGSISGLDGFAWDITAKKEAESRQLQSEEKYRLVVENATEAMTVIHRDGGFLIMNRAAARFYGGQPADFMGKSMWDLLPPAVANQQMREIRKTIDTGQGVAVENLVTVQGQQRWYNTRIEPLQGNTFKGYALVVARDVSERVEIEAALRLSEANLQRSQQLGKVGSWELELASNRLFWSPEMFRLLGYPQNGQQPTMEIFYETVHPADRDLLRAAIKASLVDASSINMDVRLQVPTQMERTANVQAQPLCDREGQVKKLIGTVQDISERKALEERLRQAQKMEAIGLLAGGIAHDFNNLLTVILGQLELVLVKRTCDAQTQKRLAEVQAAAQRASNLTRQLLAFSRRQVLQRRILDLNEITGNMANLLRRLLGEQISLSCEYAPELPSISADPSMMEQVLLNLAVNARDAMPNGGDLVLSTRPVRFVKGHPSANPDARLGRFVCWTVRDTGCGMEASVLARIFEPFFTTKQEGKGTGMGLATVYGIVQQHDGWIEVKSEVDQGTVFRIFLPATDQAKETEIPYVIGTGALPGGSETVLIVEDEESLRELERAVLEQLGYRVLEAATGSEALKIWSANPSAVDLLITDMVMPGGMTGRELADHLLGLKPALKVIYTTGYSLDLKSPDLFLKEGVNFLQKPFGPSKLAHAARNCLDGHLVAGGPLP